MNADVENCLFYGTPIEREEGTTSRKKKAIAESAGQLRTLPAWKQEVRDEDGRRRFHGAFTGGFSAGYYNTVGSREGWTPQSFTSSRKNRAEVKKQDILNFLDDDEKADLEARSLRTSSEFDTFGFTAADLARKHAEKEQKHERSSAIPGPVPDELVLPVTESIGVKLLLKMGWRHGAAIKDARTNSMYDAQREGRRAFIALSGEGATDHSTQASEDSAIDPTPPRQDAPVYILKPKKDLHGLGYDPFKNAPEFREKTSHRNGDGSIAPGFGIGAMEELGAEDEDVYSHGLDMERTSYVQEPEETLRSVHGRKQEKPRDGCLHGFRRAAPGSRSESRFVPPTIPKDFTGHHSFPSPPETRTGYPDGGPPEAPPPENRLQKLLIDGIASLVARCGKLFEDLSRERNRSNPLFSFLTGGPGDGYYARRLWEQRRDRSPNPKLTADSRGRILGEKPLLQLQYSLGDTFTRPESSLPPDPSSSSPFVSDPAKQKRFALFLKEKYEGGLRYASDPAGSSSLSESDRAREKLDFEAAAEAIERSGTVRALPPPLVTVEPAAASVRYPTREEFEWRPAVILCKRFDIPDPYTGKPPPAPRIKSKIDSLIFTPDTAASAPSIPPPPSSLDVAEPEEDPTANVERPVDLYKAIFSDDDDDDDDEEPASVGAGAAAAAAATTTLSRLVAGDFLESLGKELGLEVPPDKIKKSNASDDEDRERRKRKRLSRGGDDSCERRHSDYSTADYGGGGGGDRHRRAKQYKH